MRKVIVPTDELTSTDPNMSFSKLMLKVNILFLFLSLLWMFLRHRFEKWITFWFQFEKKDLYDFRVVVFTRFKENQLGASLKNNEVTHFHVNDLRSSVIMTKQRI